jgi:hypothetical protein
MDLTASIRLKIDVLRGSKTTRFNALSSAIERDVAMLSQQSAELFSKLEDALEEDLLPKSDADDTRKENVNERDKQSAFEEEESMAVQDESREQVALLPEEEDYQVHYGEENEHYAAYDIPRQEAQQVALAGPSAMPVPVITPKEEPTIHLPVSVTKSPDSLVSYLRSRAQETQKSVAEKNVALTQLRSKHESAMKRLDKLQSELEKVSQKWEEEERDRIQTESTTALGKRKREDEEENPRPSWKKVGQKGLEWGVVFGFGIASYVGISKFQQG